METGGPEETEGCFKSTVFHETFEKAAGGRGGAPLMFTPEVSLTSMKILLNYCFCYWRRGSRGLGDFLKKRRGAGAEPR